MPDIHVVTKERHGTKRWRRYRSYAHAAGDAVAPLVLTELSRACVALPIGFMDIGASLAPVAVLGVEPGSNLFVDRERGWTAGYIPAAYRSYPFVLGASAEAEPVLCVTEDGGLDEGEPFFDAHGELLSSVKDVFDFMIEVTNQRQATRRICGELKKHALVQPWPFRRHTDAGEQIIGGLYRVDRAALGRLSPDAFQALRQAGALPVIYCHLISMQHMPKLARLALSRSREQAVLPLSSDGDLDIEFLNDSGTVGFGSLGGPFTHSQ